MNTSRMSSFPKAVDRWQAPAQDDKSPSPDRYNPKAGMSLDVSSRQPRVPRTKFGRDNSSILDMHFSMKRAEENPGPGQHERFSEFIGKQ